MHELIKSKPKIRYYKNTIQNYCKIDEMSRMNGNLKLESFDDEEAGTCSTNEAEDYLEKESDIQGEFEASVKSEFEYHELQQFLQPEPEAFMKKKRGRPKSKPIMEPEFASNAPDIVPVVILNDPLRDEDGTLLKKTPLQQFNEPTVIFPPECLHNTANLSDIVELFNYFIDEQLVDKLVNSTNKCLAQDAFTPKITPVELRAFCGLLLMFGVTKKDEVELNEIWSIDSVNHMNWASVCMTRDRCKLICANVCFDDVDTGPELLLTNPEFHKMNEVFEIFNNLRNVGGVDGFVRKVEEYTCRRKTNRWNLNMLMNMLDAATLNSVVLFQLKNHDLIEKISRRRKIEDLALGLIKPQVIERLAKAANTNYTGLDMNLISTFQLLGFKVERKNQDSNPTTSNRGRCSHMACRRNKNDTKYKNKCSHCSRFSCRDHCDILVTIICVNCINP